MYVYTCACVYQHTRIYMCLYIGKYPQCHVDVHIYTYVYIYMYIYTCACVHHDTCIYIHRYTYICVYMYIDVTLLVFHKIIYIHVSWCTHSYTYMYHAFIGKYQMCVQHNTCMYMTCVHHDTCMYMMYR